MSISPHSAYKDGLAREVQSSLGGKKMYLVVRGLHCPKGSSLVVVSKGHFPVVGHRLLHCGGLSCCGALGLQELQLPGSRAQA